MKKQLLKSMLLLCALVVGSANAWAETAVITFSSQTSGTSDSSNAYTAENFVNSGITSSSLALGTITCSETTKCYSGKTGYGLKAGGSSAAGSFTISFSTALINVSQITLNRTSYASNKTTTITVKNGSTTLGSAATPASTEFSDMDITNLSIASLSSLTVETGKYCYIKSITITYSPSGTPTCVAPTFSPVAGAVLSGTKVTLSTTTEGATIYYTMGNNPDDPTNASIEYDSSNKPTITAATTIKAIAIKAGSNNSTVSSASYTIATPYTTISDLFSAATTTETGVWVTFNNWVVSGVSTNGKNVFVTDNNKNGFVIYSNSDQSSTYAVGDILSGTAISCKLQLYNGFVEITDLDASDLTITEGGTVSEANIDMADLAGVNTGALVSYDNLTCSVNDSKYYLSDGTTTLQVYGTLYNFGTLEAGKIYNIKGIYQQYSGTKEILPRSADDIVAEPAAPVVSGTTVTLATSANMAGWRTYNNNTTKKYSLESDTKAYYASTTGSSTVTLQEISGGVPANTIVILHKTGGTPIVLTETSAVIDAPGSNLLLASTAGQNLGKVFRLGYKSGSGKGVGFYSYTTTSAPAGIIYVAAPSAARDFLEFAFGDDETTGVNEMKAQKVDGQIYDLQGRKVATPSKGLYIVNGKKMVIK